MMIIGTQSLTEDYDIIHKVLFKFKLLKKFRVVPKGHPVEQYQATLC